jgi:hypothetical protein
MESFLRARFSRVCTAALVALLGACGDDTFTSTGDTGGTSTGSGDPIDITNTVFERRSGNCRDYVESYSSSVSDVGRGVAFTGALTITADESGCTFASNSIPNHDFNDGAASFVTPVAEVAATRRITASPVAAASATPISLEYDNAVFLNGVKLDLLAAACYGVGGEPLGQEKIGCFDIATPWRYDPMHPGNDFGTDSHNAHTQPDGTYHYHGDPRAMFDTSGATASPVIGFAADGFPIFGPWIDDGGTVRRVVSGYSLKSGARQNQTGEGAYPGGSWDGTYRDDYEFTGAGDLDECNGATRDGVYGYYLTDGYPWVLACFKGTPDESFRKQGP